MPKPDGSPDWGKAQQTAYMLVKKLGYTHPPINAAEAAKHHGLNVKFVRFSDEAKDVAGFLDLDETTIYVNEEEAPERQNFTIAHELGHWMLHKEYAQSENYRVLLRSQFGESKDAYEREADSFAANLLVPRWMLNPYRQLASDRELASMFAVSEQVIRTRMNYYRGRN